MAPLPSRRPAAVLVTALATLGLVACAEQPTGPHPAPLAAFDEIADAEEVPTCSVGLWKNTPDLWAPTGYSPGQTIGSVFANAGPYSSLTLDEALEFRGGRGLDGATEILLRAGVAALLNAAHPDNDFPMTPAQVIEEVEGALASSDRRTVLAAARELEELSDVTCTLVDEPPTPLLPDLVISSLSPDGLGWTATMMNVGTAPVDIQGVSIQGFWSSDPVWDAGDAPACGYVLVTTSLVLNPGDSRTRSFLCSAPIADYLIVTADYGQIVTESDETNNATAVGTN